jgi:large subunit ribosomal protein L21
MFAVIRTGGKQYRVAQDQFITVERLAGEPGASVTLDEVLMLGGEGSIQIGTPVLAGASVTAEVVEQTRGPKIIIFKKKRRQNYRRKKGHRQDLTVLKITAIAGA